MNFTVRYRYNKRDVQTPVFDATEYVRFDAVPEEVEEGLSPQFDNSRHLFDANVSFSPTGLGTRDWNLDNDDKINTAGVFLDLLRAFRNTNIRFSYDFNDSDNSFVHGGPRIVSLTAANQFIPLPNVENTWQRLSADVQYLFNSRVGVGVGYYFEKLDVVDFNTLDTNGPLGFSPPTGDPRLDWLGGLTLGYGNRPYTGNTAYVRQLYRF